MTFDYFPCSFSLIFLNCEIIRITSLSVTILILVVFCHWLPEKHYMWISISLRSCFLSQKDSINISMLLKSFYDKRKWQWKSLEFFFSLYELKSHMSRCDFNKIIGITYILKKKTWKLSQSFYIFLVIHHTLQDKICKSIPTCLN